ncbi:MAG TPA: hypothetical protein VG962_13405 [Steroidobacteraceae bacterium]|nr:hypothetical protein [Steroidobacteraceae bacterium]
MQLTIGFAFDVLAAIATVVLYISAALSFMRRQRSKGWGFKVLLAVAFTIYLIGSMLMRSYAISVGSVVGGIGGVVILVLAVGSLYARKNQVGQRGRNSEP